jgi:diguanylate cyclase (GGDEF)-like protein
LIDNPPSNGARIARVLLLGDASARPEGLERALARAGLGVSEGDGDVRDDAPGLVLVTVRDVDDSLRALLESAGGTRHPSIALIAGGDPGAPARALALGATEALAAPFDVAALVAAIAVRLGSTVEHPRFGERAPDAGRRSRPAPAGAEPGEALDTRLREEFERARRYALSFSLVLLDIDQVTSYEDRLGREATDRVLADIGDVLRAGLRTPDFVSRYTGDEFAVLLPETSLSGARQSVTRVRERLGSHPFQGIEPADRPRVTAGIVTFPHPAAEQIDDLFALAEAALLRARSQTGDRIGTAESAAT